MVLHELGHIKNRDIGKTYLTLAMWATFLAASVIPAFISTAFSDPKLDDVVGVAISSCLWMVNVGLSGLAVLRTREYYADLQASVWDGQLSNLDAVLCDSSSVSHPRWFQYLAFHPTSAHRRNVLADPSLLFHLSIWDALAIGIAARLVIDNIEFAAIAFAPGSSWFFPIWFWSIRALPPLITMSLAVGALGTGIWRGAFASLLRSENAYRKASCLALALMSGYMLITGLYFLRAG